MSTSTQLHLDPLPFGPLLTVAHCHIGATKLLWHCLRYGPLRNSVVDSQRVSVCHSRADSLSANQLNCGGPKLLVPAQLAWNLHGGDTGPSKRINWFACCHPTEVTIVSCYHIMGYGWVSCLLAACSGQRQRGACWRHQEGRWRPFRAPDL